MFPLLSVRVRYSLSTPMFLISIDPESVSTDFAKVKPLPKLLNRRFAIRVGPVLPKILSPETRPVIAVILCCVSIPLNFVTKVIHSPV